MPVDGSAQVGADSATCCVCGVALAAGHQNHADDGQPVCASCAVRAREIIPAELDADMRPEPQGPLEFQCAQCRRHFSVDGVYDVAGVITCVECFEKSRAAARGVQDAPHGQDHSLLPHPQSPARPARLPLLAHVTCPHCWRRFEPQDVLWVSRHSDMMGDPLLGPDAPLRFLPSRFTTEGQALDARGMACQTLACPECHLVIPRVLVETEPLFASIVGVSASGKSYFLTAMTWELRRLLPMHFAVSFSDADAIANRTLNHYEELLFLPPDADRPVKLDKTDTVGQLLYDQIRLGQQVVSLPRPFLFTMRPSSRHPNIEAVGRLSRVVCLYDNAGEHFNPGEDTTSSPVTQHLGRSRVLMFLYDPTQDPRFRARCRGLSADPQLDEQTPTRRQETILLETAARVRQYGALPTTARLDRPLVVVVPKADVWGPLIGLDLSQEPVIPDAIAGGTLDGVDMGRVEDVSTLVREMLLDTAPEFVAAAEEFCTHVVYIPVSALGTSPEMQDGRHGLWVRPRQIKPRWVTVPFLYMFARWSHDLIGGVRTDRPQTSNAVHEGHEGGHE